MKAHRYLAEAVRRHFECERCTIAVVLAIAVIGWFVASFVLG